jgi:hypothetical protein
VRKLVIILIAFFAVVTFIRAFADQPGLTVLSADQALGVQPDP